MVLMFQLVAVAVDSKLMEIKLYNESYKEEVYDLFFETVINVNIKDYNKKQVDVWANNSSVEKLNKSLLQNISVVCIFENKVIGFGDITINGYLDRLYVHKDFLNKGVGTLICDYLESKVNCKKIEVHASITANPFFRKRGYIVVKEQKVYLQNIELINYCLEKVCTL